MSGEGEGEPEADELHISEQLHLVQQICEHLQ